MAGRVQGLKGGGAPLSSASRAYFEPKLGRDLSSVRVHSGSEAAGTARGLGARAYTTGSDIAFAGGEYQPHTGAGRRLLAHELAHVVQNQDRNGESGEIRRWPDELAAASLDPEWDLESLLGPPPVGGSVAYDQETMHSLYRYLKRLRNAMGYSDPTFEGEILALLRSYFNIHAEQVWLDSQQTFAGYVGARGRASTKRMEKAKELGLTETPEKGVKKKMLASDVVFFSGHHYARYDGPCEFDDLDLKKYKFVAHRVKLIMISSCAGLRSNAMKVWNKKYPNATLLGWYTASPLSQKNMMAAFLPRIPSDTVLEDPSGMAGLLSAWESYIEDMAKTGDPVKPYGLGWGKPDGTVKYYIEKKGTWKWVTR